MDPPIGSGRSNSLQPGPDQSVNTAFDPVAELMDDEEMIARNEALEECEVDRRDEVGGGVHVKPPALVPVATESGSSDVIAADREEVRRG